MNITGPDSRLRRAIGRWLVRNPRVCEWQVECWMYNISQPFKDSFWGFRRFLSWWPEDFVVGRLGHIAVCRTSAREDGHCGCWRFVTADWLEGERKLLGDPIAFSKSVVVTEELTDDDAYSPPRFSLKEDVPNDPS